MTRARIRAGLGVAAFTAVWALGGLAWGQVEPPRGKDSKREPEEDSGSSFLENVYLELAPEFEAGKYGTKLRSDLLYLPATLGYEQDGVVASVTVPYEVERSRVGIVFVGGHAVRTSGAKRGQIKTESGLGDIYLDGGYYVLRGEKGNPALGIPGGRGMPSLGIEAEVKFPTADDERGLGTGSYDEAIRLMSSATYFEHLKLYAELEYDRIGQPEDIPSSVQKFHDAIYWSAAVGYAFSKSNELWARIDANTRITDGTPPYELFSIEWDHYFKNESKLYLSIGFGLTNSTPGLALTLGYMIWF